MVVKLPAPVSPAGLPAVYPDFRLPTPALSSLAARRWLVGQFEVIFEGGVSGGPEPAGCGFHRLVRVPAREVGAEGRLVGRIFHLSDSQLADPKSPARYEWVNLFAGAPAWSELIPGYRPQEFLVAAALAAMVRTVNRADRVEEGFEVAVFTGDAIDNAQTNELDNFLAALGGGEVCIDSGSGDRSYVYADGFAEGRFWHPEPGAGADVYKRDYSFPSVEGLLAQAFAPFVSEGLGISWYFVNGNHELLVQGLSPALAELDAIALGSLKQVGPPKSLEDPLRAALDRPAELFTSGGVREVPSDPNRALVARGQIAAALQSAPGLPRGHGVSAGSEVLYYEALLSDEVVLVALDTAYAAGGSSGAIAPEQARWLLRVLASHSSAYWDESGELVEGDGTDRLIVVSGHHPLHTIGNERALAEGYCGEEWLARALLRFPNVILYLNGHTHEHRVRLLRREDGSGVYELTTGSIMDWPNQGRTIDIVRGRNRLSLVCNPLDIDVPADPANSDGLESLAAWHRLLAANAPMKPSRPMIRQVLNLPLPSWLG